MSTRHLCGPACLALILIITAMLVPRPARADDNRLIRMFDRAGGMLLHVAGWITARQ